MCRRLGRSGPRTRDRSGRQRAHTCIRCFRTLVRSPDVSNRLIAGAGLTDPPAAVASAQTITYRRILDETTDHAAPGRPAADDRRADTAEATAATADVGRGTGGVDRRARRRD